MEQRPLRLGDIVDDYCPRERRITNHAIVAIVENAIRQTRCSTCDSEHVHKEARVPKRRQADPAVTEKSGLAPKPAAAELEPEPVADVEGIAEPAAEVAAVADTAAAPEPAVMQAATDDSNGRSAESEDAAPVEEPADGWASHRRLIRATLPRVEGEEPPARPIPEFTMHQRQTRGSHAFRGQGNGPMRGGNGSRGNGQGRGGPRHGRPGGGQGNGNGSGNGQPAGGGRSRRSRHRGPKRPR